jgi:AraC-like DNA-binding protein
MKYIVGTGGYATERINLHAHKTYEIVLYVSGSGVLSLDGKQIPVKKGNIFIAPPNVKHGSLSHDNLRYISLILSKDQLLYVKSPTVFMDNDKGYARCLAQMILENKHGNQEFLEALCKTYILFVLENVEINTDIDKAVHKIKEQIASNFYDSKFSATKILNESGYAEDYIRAHFKKILGKTPVEFLVETRIDNAKSLINVYHNDMSLVDVALNCGFEDYIYFSRKFKQLTGLSPYEYKKSVCH